MEVVKIDEKIQKKNSSSFGCDGGLGFFVPGVSSTAEITKDVCVCRENITSIIHLGARRPEPFPHLTDYSVRRFHVTLLSKSPFLYSLQIKTLTDFISINLPTNKTYHEHPFSNKDMYYR